MEESKRWLTHPDNKPCAKFSNELDPENIQFYPCLAEAWLWMPKWMRSVFGHITLAMYCFLFLTTPYAFSFILLIPQMWTWYPLNFFSIFWLFCLVLSYILPWKEWPAAREVGQLWYELFDLKVNLTRQDLWQLTHEGDWRQYVMCVYPHGVIPVQAVLCMSFWDQYFSVPKEDFSPKQYMDLVEARRDTSAKKPFVHNTDGVSSVLVQDNQLVRMDQYGDYSNARKRCKSLYGFGAVADVMTYLPFTRNMTGWFTCGSAGYKHLRDGLKDGKCAPANKNNGRIPKNLALFPGGIAELFLSTPGKNIVVMKKRYGLMKLALETGANLTPCYLFGGSDLFYNLATFDGSDADNKQMYMSGYLRQGVSSMFTTIAKRFRIGMTFWWGSYFSPIIPLKPKLRFAIGRPIPVKKWEGDPKNIDRKEIERLHQVYVKAMEDLFDRYKAAAGYPDAVLEIR